MSLTVAESVRAITEHGAELRAFLEVFDAPEVERAAGSAHEPALAGVPIAVKDNICTAFGRTTCGSRFLEHYRSPFTATAVRRLLDAGAAIVGKANMDEFAMGSSGEHSAFGPTRNPWDLTRVPGGSSSGSAAAVAAGLVPIALGSDTGGSIRQPAGFCGVVGFKPTYGRVSRSGLVAYASSLDQIGTLARTVYDATLAARVISGHDPADATSAGLPVEPWERGLEDHDALRRDARGWRVGVPTDARDARNHPAVAAALGRATDALRDLGASVVEVSLPHAAHAIAAYYIIASAEASSNLARFDGVRFGRRATLGPEDSLVDLYERSRSEGFGPEVQRRIMLGTHTLRAGYADEYYTTALRARRLIAGDYRAVFERAGAACDAILMPTSPTPAFAIGAHASDPSSMYLEDVYTVGVNLAGLPAIALPAGFTGPLPTAAYGLPVGVQLIGSAFGEAGLVRIAAALELALGFAGRRPPPNAGAD